jgi:hypothetical protein
MAKKSYAQFGQVGKRDVAERAVGVNDDRTRIENKTGAAGPASDGAILGMTREAPPTRRPKSASGCGLDSRR